MRWQLTIDCEKHHNLVNKYSVLYILLESKVLFLYMRYIQGISRHQLQLSSLEDKTTADNPYTYSGDLLSKFITSQKGKQLIYMQIGCELLSFFSIFGIHNNLKI